MPSDLDRLLVAAAPVPVRAYLRHGGTERVAGQGLWRPRGHDSAWARRCRRQPELAFALWSVLERMPGIAVDQLELAGSRTYRQLIGRIGGAELRLDSVGGTTLGVSVAGAGLLTPGATLEELVSEASSANEMVVAEIARAMGWLRADEALGLRALLGPVPRRLYENQTKRRIAEGYLDADLCLTRGGWWRLAYTARQAVGIVERQRQVALRRMARFKTDAVKARGLRRKHLRATQQVVLAMWRDEGMVPLGVEVSGVGGAVGRRYGMRADALLADEAATRLVWVEVLRRPETQMPLLRRDGYRRKRELMADVAEVLQVRVEWRLFEPRGGWERWTVGADARTELAEVLEATP